MRPIVYDVWVNGNVVAERMDAHIALMLAQALLYGNDEDPTYEVTIRRRDDRVMNNAAD